MNRGVPVRIPATARARQSLLNRAALQSGAGTVASRVTGLLRLVMVVYALGGGHVADAFNLANSTPNIIHDLVLGGVLGATFVPVFVERLARSSRVQAIDSISAVLSLSIVGLVVATALFEFGAPWIIDLYTFHSGSVAEQHVAVELLRYFAPQLFCYGAISLMSAVLATQDRFAAVGIVPVLNNLVGIVVLAVFAAVDRHPDVTALAHQPSKLLFLGLGTTAGVVLQAAALVPSMRRSRLGLHFVWRPSDPAVRRIVSLSGWTFGFVVANQIAVFVILALQYHLGSDGVSSYTYAYTFFQMPFGVAAVAVVNVATPDLARAYALGDLELMGRRFGSAIRKLLALILPSMVAYLVLAKSAIPLLIQHGTETPAYAQKAAAVLVMFSLGLPAYCIYFLCVRAFQAMQDTQTAFLLYLLENGLNVLVAFLLYRSLGVQGLALAYSIAYTVGAAVALFVLRERLGALGGRSLVSSSARSFGLAIFMAVVLAFVTTVLGTGSGLFGWIRLFIAVAVGGLAYLGGAGVAGTLAGLSHARRAFEPGRGTINSADRRRHRQRKRPPF